MDHERKDHQHGAHTPVERALEEVHEAERELETAHHVEEVAEEHLKKAVHDLEEAVHRKPHTVELIINTRAKPWTGETISYEQVVALAALPLGLSRTQGQAAEGSLPSCFHALFACGSPKQSARRRFCSRTVHAPAKPKPFRSQSMASKPQIVRRAVWNERKPPIRGMFFLTRKWSLSMPCCRCLVT